MVKQFIHFKTLFIMKNFKITLILLFLSVFMFAGFSQLKGQAFSGLGSQDIAVDVPCANGGLGEIIGGEIPLHIVVFYKDGVPVRMHANAIGFVLHGFTTGDRYNIVGSTQFLWDINPSKGAYTETFVDRTHIVGKGTQYFLKTTAHFTLNPNGEITSDFYVTYEYCK